MYRHAEANPTAKIEKKERNYAEKRFIFPIATRFNSKNCILSGHKSKFYALWPESLLKTK